MSAGATLGSPIGRTVLTRTPHGDYRGVGPWHGFPYLAVLRKEANEFVLTIHYPPAEIP